MPEYYYEYHPEYHPEHQKIIDEIENKRFVDLVMNDCGKLCKIVYNIRTKKYETEILEPR